MREDHTRQTSCLASEIRVGVGLLLFCRYSLAMNEDDEERIAAHLAKTMAMMCVRNTELKNIHAGLTPVTRTGDYSDDGNCQRPLRIWRERGSRPMVLRQCTIW